MKQAFPNPGFHSDLNAEICPRLCPGAFLVSLFVYARPVFNFLTGAGKPSGSGWAWLEPGWRLAGAWLEPGWTQPAAHGNSSGPGAIFKLILRNLEVTHFSVLYILI